MRPAWDTEKHYKNANFMIPFFSSFKSGHNTLFTDQGFTKWPPIIHTLVDKGNLKTMSRIFL